MRIAFYAPLKPPDHPVPSGDRRMARLLLEALRGLGHAPAVASTFRARAATDDPKTLAAHRARGLDEADRVVAALRALPAAERPALWFTYHLYYKAPDWIGPRAAVALDLPYVVAEVSHAPKRANGVWSAYHADVEAAIAQARSVLCLTRHDARCVAPLVRAPARLFALPPFLNPEPFAAAAARRATIRAALAARHRLDPAGPWLLTVAMMRRDVKLESYRELAAALGSMPERPWALLIVGDGEARAEVEASFVGLGAERVRFLGERAPEALAELYAAADLYLWPAVGEAYGMALLEASAAGLPVVAGAIGGVPDIVIDRRTGLLARANDPPDFAGRVMTLLDDPALRQALGTAARAFVASERSLGAARAILDRALTHATADR
ncbi:MAG: glycosyltransferase family 4 protein [Alphaproteobacteria bacterium]|nr:glycosyltransferase family 4 protein [Alphaproteobacteria bacterium]